MFEAGRNRAFRREPGSLSPWVGFAFGSSKVKIPEVGGPCEECTSVSSQVGVLDFCLFCSLACLCSSVLSANSRNRRFDRYGDRSIRGRDRRRYGYGDE